MRQKSIAAEDVTEDMPEVEDIKHAGISTTQPTANYYAGIDDYAENGDVLTIGMPCCKEFVYACLGIKHLQQGYKLYM